MTETASGPARSSRAKGTKAVKGLRIERIHTTPGVHPYDEVEWARRDVVMTNWRDGSVNFEHFIETKVKEEEKIRALRDAGFDMDLGGEDITSVQYQNANNSVRVNDT